MHRRIGYAVQQAFVSPEERDSYGWTVWWWYTPLVEVNQATIGLCRLDIEELSKLEVPCEFFRNKHFLQWRRMVPWTPSVTARCGCASFSWNTKYWRRWGQTNLRETYSSVTTSDHHLLCLGLREDDSATPPCPPWPAGSLLPTQSLRSSWKYQSCTPESEE